MELYAAYRDKARGDQRGLEGECDDPAIPFLNIYPKVLRSGKDSFIPTSIAELFTITKVWKQCNYPLIDEWVKKMWYTSIHMREYYLNLKKMKALAGMAQ